MKDCKHKLTTMPSGKFICQKCGLDFTSIKIKELEAENERLKGEVEYGQLTNKEWRKVCDDLQAQLAKYDWVAMVMAEPDVRYQCWHNIGIVTIGHFSDILATWLDADGRVMSEPELIKPIVLPEPAEYLPDQIQEDEKMCAYNEDRLCGNCLDKMCEHDGITPEIGDE